MSKNLHALLGQAAQLRSAGGSWEAVARKVNRKASTCSSWPRRHAAVWKGLYREACNARFEELGNEAESTLRALLRNEDHRIQIKSAEVLLRHRTIPPEITAPNANVPDDGQQRFTREEWLRNDHRVAMDKWRAERNLPPYKSQEERLGEIKMYYQYTGDQYVKDCREIVELEDRLEEDRQEQQLKAETVGVGDFCDRPEPANTGASDGSIASMILPSIAVLALAVGMLNLGMMVRPKETAAPISPSTPAIVYTAQETPGIHRTQYGKNDVSKRPAEMILASTILPRRVVSGQMSHTDQSETHCSRFTAMSTIRPPSDSKAAIDAPPREETVYSEVGLAFKPGALIANYRLLEKLGEGGMGAVFIAEDVNLRRKVALKLMKPTIATEGSARVRFLREACAAARIEHDNIVPIYQAGEHNGTLFLAMQLLHGESLRSRLKRDPRPNLPFVIKVSRDVAQGLAAAHALGFVHRDIKPDNIWIESHTVDDPSMLERAKVLDFGLVRPQENDEHLTRAGAMLGTPAYMSPEQACGESVDHRADLFSLGCVMYQMATGRLPFSGSSAFSILSNLALSKPPEPRSLNPELPPQLANLILWLLEKEPSKRPGSAREVVEVLRQLQPDLSAQMPALPTAERSVEAILVQEARPEPRQESRPEPRPKPVANERPPLPRPPELDEARPVRQPRTILWIATIAAGVLVAAGIGYLTWESGALQPADKGTLAIEMDDEAAAILKKKGEIQIQKLNGDIVGRFLPSEPSRVLEVGTYRIKIIDVKGLQAVPDQINVEKNSKATVRVRISPVL